MKFASTATSDRSRPYLWTMVWILVSTMVAAYTQAQGVPDASGLPASQNGIDVRSWVDRTALYPGDTVNYHIEIQTNSTTDILRDDLLSDELILDGLELETSDLQQKVTDAGINYHARYSFTTFESGRSELGIAALSVRYYHKRPGQRLEDVVTAGEISLPAVRLALSSTLTSAPGSLALRDAGMIAASSSILDHAGTVGLFLIVLSAILFGLMIRSRQAPATVEQDEQALEVMLEHTSSVVAELRRHDSNDDEQRRTGFEEIENTVKQYLETMSGLAAQALTSGELIQRLADRGKDISLKDLRTVLERSETARYGRHEDLPSAGEFEHSIAFVQGLLSSR